MWLPAALTVEGERIMPAGGAPFGGNKGVCGVTGGFIVLPPQRRQFPVGPAEFAVDAVWVLPLRPNLRG